MGNIEMGRKVFVLQLFHGFLQSNNVPFTCCVFLKSTGVPRRGPELQLRVLIRVCSCWRFGLLLSNWQQHVIDLYKPPETQIMAEKSELENLYHGAMKNGGHARAAEARVTLDMALVLTKRSCKPEEYDEQHVAYVEGSYFFPPPPRPKKSALRWKVMTGKRKKVMTPDGRRIGWGFVVVRE